MTFSYKIVEPTSVIVDTSGFSVEDILERKVLSALEDIDMVQSASFIPLGEDGDNIGRIIVTLEESAAGYYSLLSLKVLDVLRRT